MVVASLIFAAIVVCAPGASLADAVARAAPGDTIVVRGIHEGNVRIDKKLTILGEPLARLVGGGKGSVLAIAAAGTTVRDLAISGSGDSLLREDSGVVVESASDVTLENLDVTDTLFGIHVKASPGARVVGCRVVGRAIHIAQRGDGIRLYASPRSRVERCTVEETRDVILWFSEGSAFEDNTIRRARYGLHLMNTHDGVCERNTIEDASVGIFSMYSNRVVLRNNRIGPVRGPSGYGIGLKDTDAFRVERNVIGDARIGIFDDGSPLRPDAPGLIAGNWVLWCDAALSFMPSVNGVAIAGNAFAENATQIEIRGGGRLRGNDWAVDGRGNFWSDYDGFEARGSGTGATPYRAMALYEALTDAHPDLKLFDGGLAARAIDWGARVVPLVAPDPKVEDPHPLVAPPPFPEVPAGRRAEGSARVAALGLVLLSLGVGALLSLGRLS